MGTLKILAEMLAYPESKNTLLERYYTVFMLQMKDESVGRKFDEFCRWYEGMDLGSLQEEYVATFDLNRTISLNLFDYAYGDSCERGPAMAELIEAYEKAGLLLVDEMPDYLPVVLEFMAEAGNSLPRQQMDALMNGLEQLRDKLEESGSKYALLADITASTIRCGCGAHTGGN